MPKYWEKLIFSVGSFPEVGQKQEREREREREERKTVSVNNDQPCVAHTSHLDHQSIPLYPLVSVESPLVLNVMHAICTCRVTDYVIMTYSTWSTAIKEFVEECVQM